MTNEQKPTKAVETKRIVGTNLYRALAEFETAVRGAWDDTWKEKKGDDVYTLTHGRKVVEDL